LIPLSVEAQLGNIQRRADRRHSDLHPAGLGTRRVTTHVRVH